MKEILEKIKGMDKKQLSDAIKQAKEFAATPQGKELVEKIKKGETGINKTQHAEIMEQINKNPDIAKAVFDILKG